MHYLPPMTSPIRDLFSIERDLVPIGAKERLPMLFNDARRAAVKFIAANRNVKTVTSLAMRGNDDLVLIEIGARGGHRCNMEFRHWQTFLFQTLTLWGWQIACQSRWINQPSKRKRQ